MESCLALFLYNVSFALFLVSAESWVLPDAKRKERTKGGGNKKRGREEKRQLILESTTRLLTLSNVCVGKTTKGGMYASMRCVRSCVVVRCSALCIRAVISGSISYLTS